jgi:hypothetical protein
MSLGNWGENLLGGAAGAFFGSPYLRDYQHASKIFRTNSYENTPKLKFLFHTYFDINPEAFPTRNNFGILVKQVRLPSFNLTTHQMNQYNRKRIVQTKIKYDPIEITFHDDAGNNINTLWQAYYKYYYNDGSKPSQVLRGERGAQISNPELFEGDQVSPIENYNFRDIYENAESKNYDWGFSGGNNAAFQESGVKVPFFNSITVFGFNQHNFTAYTLINPIITMFSHDTYNYDSGNGTMENKMTVDYETVVYNYGAMDGREPSNIVTGFGLEESYDRSPSPIMTPGSNGAALGRGGLIDSSGGFVDNPNLNADLYSASVTDNLYNGTKYFNLTENASNELNSMLSDAITNTPSNRNSLFSIPGAGQTPGLSGLAGSPTINARSSPQQIISQSFAGVQFTGNEIGTGFPVEAPFGSSFNIGPSGE